MNFSKLLALLRKWGWLIVIACAISGGITYVMTAGLPPLYEAHATVIVGDYISTTNPTPLDIYLSGEASQIYVHLSNREEIINAVAEELGSDLPPEYIAASFFVRRIGTTSLLTIGAINADPVFAVDLVNNIAEQLSIFSRRAMLPVEEAEYEANRQRLIELATLNEESARQLERLQDLLEITTGPSARASLETHVSTLTAEMTRTALYISIFSYRNYELERRISTVTIVERATDTTIFSETPSTGFAITSILATLSAAIGILILMHSLDDKFHNTEEIASTMKLPVFASIGAFGTKEGGYQRRLLSHLKPMSIPFEQYNRLRTNLLYSMRNYLSESPVYIITSPQAGEGKSLTSANLAITLAMSGLRVLLIDADLRRPRLHEIFRLENQVGLTTLISNPPVNEADSPEQARLMTSTIRQCVQPTTLPNLNIITSGLPVVNQIEFFSSTLVKQWIDVFRRTKDIDAIVVDTPPCLVVADSLVLASTIKAFVLLVVNSQRTPRMAAMQAKRAFEDLGVDIQGVILNEVNAKEEYTEYGYTYSQYYKDA